MPQNPEPTEIPDLPGLAVLIACARGEAALTDTEVVEAAMRLRTDAVIAHNERFEESLGAFVAETSAKHARQLEAAFADGAVAGVTMATGLSADAARHAVKERIVNPHTVVEVSFDADGPEEG